MLSAWKYEIRCLRGLLIRKVAEQDRVETRGDIRATSFDKGKTSGEDIYIYINIFRGLDLRTVNT